MTATLRVLQAGPGVTLQDGGRWGYLRYGVTAAGPMDVLAHEVANRAAGREANAAAVEISVGGFEAMVEDASLDVAVVAPGFRVSRDGAALPSACFLTLAPRQRLSIRAGDSGAWGYLALAGRIDAQPELGSLSMHVRTGVGGGGFKAGDLIHVADVRASSVQPRALPPVRDMSAIAPIRVVLGPQDDYFDAENIARFLDGPWRVAARSDRMAYALEGPRIAHAKGFNIVSDGIAFGAIQIPGDGAPFVQMADRAPTGGYPKIANAIAADLGRLAQMRPGATLRFEAVTVAEAVAAWKAARAGVDQALTGAANGGDLSAEALLGANLVSGVVSAVGGDDH